MPAPTSVTDSTAPFDVRPHALAERFGARAAQLMRDGRDPYLAARLAFSFADRALRRRDDDVRLDEFIANLEAAGVRYGTDFGVTH